MTGGRKCPFPVLTNSIFAYLLLGVLLEECGEVGTLEPILLFGFKQNEVENTSNMVARRASYPFSDFLQILLLRE